MSITRYLERDSGEKQPLATDSFEKIQADILNGTLQSGSRLTEKQICEACHVSRTPARETLQRLEADGLIETVPNCGAIVRGLTSRDLQDIFAVKIAAERSALRWAAERITESELDRLTEIFGFMEFYTERNDVEKMQNINLAFHQIIYEAVHNRILTRQLTKYEIYLDQSMPPYSTVPGVLEEVLKEHRMIYDAIRMHDGDAAAEAADFHLHRAFERFFPGQPLSEVLPETGEHDNSLPNRV